MHKKVIFFFILKWKPKCFKARMAFRRGLEEWIALKWIVFKERHPQTSCMKIQMSLKCLEENCSKSQMSSRKDIHLFWGEMRKRCMILEGRDSQMELRKDSTGSMEMSWELRTGIFRQRCAEIKLACMQFEGGTFEETNFQMESSENFSYSKLFRTIDWRLMFLWGMICVMINSFSMEKNFASRFLFSLRKGQEYGKGLHITFEENCMKIQSY